MRVLLDENLPRKLKRHFDEDVEVVTVKDCGWAGMQNGELLQLNEVLKFISEGELVRKTV